MLSPFRQYVSRRFQPPANVAVIEEFIPDVHVERYTTNNPTQYTMTPALIDFQLPEPTMHRPTGSVWQNMRTPFWTAFFDERMHAIFRKGGRMIDIGGGLRIDPKRGNKVDAEAHRKFTKYLSDPNVQYHVTDYTDRYHPDFVEDIHALSFENDSIDALLCIAVLEHVYDPKKAAEELIRVLKKGGEAFLYVPFIYRYHANVTKDYKDYYRYSKDGIGYLFRACSKITICPVRGLFESLLRCTPLHLVTPFALVARILDWSVPKMRQVSERQASGYFVHVVK